MFCRKCGKQLEEDSIFCSSCGTNVAGAIETPSVATEMSTSPSTPTPSLVQPSRANLEAEDLSSKEIAAIQAKLSSHRHNQTVWGITSLIGVYAIVSAAINPNTGLLVAGIAWIVFCLIMVGVYESKHAELLRKLEGEDISEPIGVRYGDGEHQWHVLVNNTKHVVTLNCGVEHTIMLDDDVIENVIESGYVRSNKVYNFEIDGKRALVTSKASKKHGYIHKLFVSGKQID